MFLIFFFIYFFNWDIFNIQHCKCKVYDILIFCCWFSVWMNYPLLTVGYWSPLWFSLSHAQLHVTPWTAAYRLPCPSLSPTVWANSCPLSRNWWCHPTTSSCHPLLLLPSIFPSIRVFSIETPLHIRWPKCWSPLQLLYCCLFHPSYLLVFA